jgi:hypothetical protein
LIEGSKASETSHAAKTAKATKASHSSSEEIIVIIYEGISFTFIVATFLIS